jgi:hypothetical protein
MFSQPSTNSEFNQYQVYPWRKFRTKWVSKETQFGGFLYRNNFEEDFANFVELTRESFF